MSKAAFILRGVYLNMIFHLGPCASEIFYSLLSKEAEYNERKNPLQNLS